MLFRDRRHAGRLLAEKVVELVGGEDVVVLALPRGGVPVAHEVARALGAPLDVFLVRKLGVPEQEELAMGAIASGGVCVLNEDVIQTLGIPTGVVDFVAREERRELERRAQLYRGDRSAPAVHGKTVVLVDDGLATGATVRAAVRALRKLGPARLIVAVPVAAGTTCDALRSLVDEMVCAVTPEPFYAVGAWYDDFSQTSDQEVRELLETAPEGYERPRSVKNPQLGC
jgi:putative phosphoribosyl transferase